MQPQTIDESKALKSTSELKESLIDQNENTTAFSEVNMGTVVINALANKIVKDETFRKTFIVSSREAEQVKMTGGE